MEIIDTGNKLMEEGFRFGGEERLGHFFEEGFEVVFEEVEDKKDTVYAISLPLRLMRVMEGGKGRTDFSILLVSSPTTTSLRATMLI